MTQPNICPKFEKAISILSQRWTGLVIYQLLNGTQRFNEIQSAIGISGKVLSDRLKDLEQKGLVKRDVIPDTPVVIEYSLTDKGRSMEPILKTIEQWALDWMQVDETQQ
ncbi:putative HTH-type transcriptional regulator YvaP [Halolactibacillus alkaliphilus]|uniref:Putative HTH-type transcriptional regulator YvaP n=1 Tax=Halolactibacillus alkaliphilus TaxID=442899 RepID=A0A511WWU6_9BACI|nr:helix-turn-helix domain-containing protein [Halolactibacillus alkaliphilus]GEN55596.1 putative HTH-type transcriptional regulator YvaP [Halolactibacillus alkaliphilus]GGN63844.1 putative HTH-type transcriptional regulator YvaP [Halolactibacillus alkaliphilus]SFO62338.1 transcriptional regulator, HxlR family [Halolactibacillus alkaliphilus]